MYLTDGAKEFIAEHGFDPIYGARPLKRFIQRNLETKLAREIIAGKIHEHSKVTIKIQDGEMVLSS
jgi:ATP-dependent Clp protease ATP-binding subunit ClpB